jgi:hypothetical protein
VLPGQLDRSRGVLGRPPMRPEGFDRRQVRQASALKKRPSDLAGQGDSLLQAQLYLIELGCPVLGAAEPGHGQRVQALAQARPGRILGVSLERPCRLNLD